MAKPPIAAVRKLPWWLTTLGSALIAFHLSAVLVLSLSAPSGPWPFMMTADLVEGPMFANVVNNITFPYYLRPLGMIHNYHFISNRTAAEGVSFEVVLRDESGVEIKRLKFPEANASYYVKHRQQLLAQQLFNDVPVPPRGSEKVATKGTVVPRVEYWLNKKGVSDLVNRKDEAGKPLPGLLDKAKLELFPDVFDNKEEHLVRIALPENIELPPGAAQMRPSPWSLLLVKSYLRHLCAKHHAHSAELIRHSKAAVLPPYAIMAEPPAQAFTETIVHYGDLKSDFEEVQK